MLNGLEGMSSTETAAILNILVGAVRSRLSRDRVVAHADGYWGDGSRRTDGHNASIALAA
jgi:hypothetical protein